MLDALKGYRTVAIGAVMAALGFLETVSWIDIVPAGYEGIVMAALGGVMMYLRSLTTTPIFTAPE